MAAMQTQRMESTDVGVPALERAAGEGESPERTLLETLPFTIGRVESNDLQVDSTRVSREHARILLEGNSYLIRDLGSTNGTFLNGDRIDEAPLNDGDVLTIADTDFTFIVPQSSSLRDTATQVMTTPGGVVNQIRQHGPHEYIYAVRRMHEVLLHRGFDAHLRPIIRSADRTTFGYNATVSSAAYELPVAGLRGVALPTPCRLTSRLEQLYRAAALEKFLGLGEGAHLVLTVEPGEIEHEPRLDSHIARLRDLVRPSGVLIVALPAEAACDLPYVRDFRNALEQLGVDAAYRDFVGQRAQVRQLEIAPPNYLFLAESMTREALRGDSQRSRLRAVLDACAEINCQPIATGVRSAEDEDSFQDLGFDLLERETA